MSIYTIDEVVQKWKLEELTSEQAIGQMVQHLQVMNDRVGLVERRVEKLYRERQTRLQQEKGNKAADQNGKTVVKRNRKKGVEKRIETGPIDSSNTKEDE